MKQEEVCVIDALLADIRKGFTLRKTKNRHELDAIPKTLPAESPQQSQSGKDTDPTVPTAIHSPLPLSLSQAQKQEAFAFAFGAFYLRRLCSQCHGEEGPELLPARSVPELAAIWSSTALSSC